MNRLLIVTSLELINMFRNALIIKFIDEKAH